MTPELVPTLFDYTLSDTTDPSKWVSRTEAEKLFSIFAAHPLFKWNESHNGCEARADAVCVLLDQWQLPHYKAWVFSGDYLKNHIGGLVQHWNYHVAAVLPLKEDGRLVFYVVDPAEWEMEFPGERTLAPIGRVVDLAQGTVPEDAMVSEFLQMRAPRG